MRSRRTALIGVGSLLAGAGGLLGTTAFSSVKADRTASVRVAGDDSALLGIKPADGVDRHVDITDGTVTIDLRESIRTQSRCSIVFLRSQTTETTL